MFDKLGFRKTAAGWHYFAPGIVGGALAGAGLAGISNVRHPEKTKQLKKVDLAVGTGAGALTGAALAAVGGRVIPGLAASKHFGPKIEAAIKSIETNAQRADETLAAHWKDITGESALPPKNLEDITKATNAFKSTLRSESFKNVRKYMLPNEVTTLELANNPITTSARADLIKKHRQAQDEFIHLMSDLKKEKEGKIDFAADLKLKRNKQLS